MNQLMNHKQNIASGMAICATTVLLCLIVIEKAVEWYLPSPYDWDKRLMFFSEGIVFENKNWGGFLYQPNARIRSETFYITDTKTANVVKEYGYQITTNSFGLIQLGDISWSKPAIIFLGNSFTEGQGASPWFYELERRWPKTAWYQIINGGIVGTGFEAWERLYENLPLRTEDRKIVIIFISSDWTRPVWQVSKHDLDCIRLPDRCSGADNFFGLPNDPTQAQTQINRIAARRLEKLSEEKHKQNILKASAIHQRLLAPAYHLLFQKSEEIDKFEKSKIAIRQLADSVGTANILFIQLPQKSELFYEPDSFSRLGREYIHQNKFKFVDGFENCNLTIADFHIHDGHPNASGYIKIIDCVERSVKEAFHLGAQVGHAP